MTYVPPSAGSVSKVFGRSGDVTQEPDDYPASYIDNDSTVLGDNVAEALDTLKSVDLSSVSGTLGIDHGGTGQTTAQAARNALLPTQAANTVLASDGTNVSFTSVGLGTATVTGTLPIGKGGTGQITAQDARNALLPAQSANTFLGSDGTNVSFSAVSLTSSVTGTLPIGSGGTGQTTAQNARNALLPAQSADTALVSDGTNVSFSSLGLGSNTITGTLPITKGGTGEITAQAARNALLPTQAANAALLSDGTNVSFGLVGLTSNVTGTLSIGNGGTGQTTAQNARNALLPAQSANTFLGSNGTDVSFSAVNLTTSVSGALPIANGGTGQTTAQNARNALLPTQANNTVLTSDGTNVSFNALNLATSTTGTLPIANGGTGQTTAQAARNALLPAQSANTYLFSDGTNVSFAAIAGIYSVLNIPALVVAASPTYTTVLTVPCAVSTAYTAIVDVRIADDPLTSVRSGFVRIIQAFHRNNVGNAVLDGTAAVQVSGGFGSLTGTAVVSGTNVLFQIRFTTGATVNCRVEYNIVPLVPA